MQKKIVFLGVTPEEQVYFVARCPEEWDSVYFEQACPALDTVMDCQALSVFVHTHVDAALLASLPRLKVIVTRSTGFDHIDLAACLARSIQVFNAPAYGSCSVAEHAFALLLSAARRITLADRRIANGDFTIEGLRGSELADKVFGIIGTGRIGRHAARIARGFNMRVLACDPYPDAHLAEQHIVQYVTRDALLAQSDILSLHCPASADSYHLLDASAFATMRRGMILINTARGDLIDACVLLAALDQGHVAAAGLDVFESESCLHCPPCAVDSAIVSAERALLTHKNVIVTPHIAFDTVEAVARLWQTTLDNLSGFFAGRTENRVA